MGGLRGVDSTLIGAVVGLQRGVVGSRPLVRSGVAIGSRPRLDRALSLILRTYLLYTSSSAILRSSLI